MCERDGQYGWEDADAGLPFRNDPITEVLSVSKSARAFGELPAALTATCATPLACAISPTPGVA
ncbi:hypothetical protein LAN31_22820, partial [Mycobacterium tuberculosis]|nr:hypothetical protein [Mycobacterium tuberculosis]